MTRDEIIKLARECADNCDGYGFAFYTRSLERLAALVAAAEREECADVCEGHYDTAQAARAIRARGEK